MTLHIFNPEHDLALAANLAQFTAPHAGRQLRCDLGYLPALWAERGDGVLVDHAEYARRQLRRLAVRLGDSGRGDGVELVERSQLGTLSVSRIEPWGWDLALCHQLKRWGVEASLLPTEEQLSVVRELSHRRYAMRLAEALRGSGSLVGDARELRSEEEVAAYVGEHPEGAVLKAPWSSSGRGVRFVSGPLSVSVGGWLRNVLARQGSVMGEPLYRWLKDFGMEFFSDGHGRVRYLGLSLFHTLNGAYTGNVLATEQAKEQMMERWVAREQLCLLRERMADALGTLYDGRYEGPLGVDLMVTDGGIALAEINLRRTMGHVALALSPRGDDEERRIMRIVLEDHYKLKIRKQ